MQSVLKQLLHQALCTLQHHGTIPHALRFQANLTTPKQARHGDYTTNIALLLAKPCGKPAHDLAAQLVSALQDHPLLERVEATEPGFINFFLNKTEQNLIITAILDLGEHFGHHLGMKKPFFLTSTAALSTAKSHPFYDVQYAHARISCLLRQLQERGITWSEQQGLQHLDLLIKPEEACLVSFMNRYSDVLQMSSFMNDSRVMIDYLQALANHLHNYYNILQLLCEREELWCARICLLKAVRQVLQNGIQWLGVSASENL
jgi:arginyl-tRNA synthetase